MMKQLNYWIASKDHHARKKNLSASMTFDPKWYLKYGTKQCLLLRILYCTGLLSVSHLVLDFMRITAVLEYPIKMYGFEINTYVGITMIYIKTILLMFVNPTWINFIILLYCFLCRHVSKLIRLSRVDIEDLHPKSLPAPGKQALQKMKPN
ncbi:hypothetical protein CEXT_792521 [Caerostris extrusa]|uniref:Uncharacterized protein n=1 Tax=Caerostris extrusa TaxID=172846 RepID=A0AAV4VU85_CAEEX|nr:hypothetical protein CEXT_792521 [Caerostris extrusa]